jgi:hemerythrin
MEAWAASKRFCNVLFLCINVDELLTQAQAASKKFIHELNLLQSTIGFAEERPAFGQLGCSGFIVADMLGNVILPKSPAYLQYGQHAFLWMERFLASLQNKDSELGTSYHPTNESVNNNTETNKTTCSSTQDVFGVLSSSLKKTSIKSMDDDHVACFGLLGELKSKKGQRKSEALKSLEALRSHLLDHFEQEEFFMDRCKYGGGRKGMGFEGHKNDHNAIIQCISLYINNLQRTNCKISDDLTEKKWIDDTFILDVAKALHHHIEAYDSLYTEDFHAAGFK